MRTFLTFFSLSSSDDESHGELDNILICFIADIIESTDFADPSSSLTLSDIKPPQELNEAGQAIFLFVIHQSVYCVAILIMYL